VAKIPDTTKWFPSEQLPEICQLLRKMLLVRASRSGVGYDPYLDSLYRRIRGGFMLSIKRDSRIRSIAKFADSVLPSSLADLPSHRPWSDWRSVDDLGDDALVRFQGHLLSKMLAAGIEPAWDSPTTPEPPPNTEGTSATRQKAVEAIPPPAPVNGTPRHEKTQAQIRAAQRKRQVLQLRDEGLTIKEIARQLKWSKRTIEKDVANPQ